MDLQIPAASRSPAADGAADAISSYAAAAAVAAAGAAPAAAVRPARLALDGSIDTRLLPSGWLLLLLLGLKAASKTSGSSPAHDQA